MGGRIVFCCILALLLSVTFGMSEAVGVTVISVDATKSTGTINPVFRDFAQGSESGDPAFIQPLVTKMAALHPRLIRIDSTLNAYTNVTMIGNTMYIDWSLLDQY